MSVKVSKPVWLIIGLIVILLVSYLIYTSYQSNLNKEYPITKNESEIQRHLVSWENRDGENLHTKLYKFEHIDETDTYIVFFENQDGAIGIGRLKEGANKKLKLTNTRSGPGKIAYDWAKTDRGYYGIVYGRNAGKQVRSIKAIAHDKSFSFTVQIPDEEYFMVYKKLPKGADGEEFAVLYYYDRNNKQIFKEESRERVD